MTVLLEIKDSKATKILKSLEDTKLIKIINDPLLGLTGKKRLQARDFLKSYKQAKLAGEGKIKLKTAQSLLDEL